MNDRDDELRQTTALFRYGLIADLVHLPLGAPGTAAKLSDKAGQTYAIPGTTRTRVAANTMRDWIRLYRDGGFEALYPKPRADRGQPRRMPPEVAERLVGLKADNPAWSVRSVIRAAIEDGIEHPLAASTVHRLFSREGLFDRKPPDGADRRRFAFRDAGELWMSDVMHGPKVRHGRSRRKTYLIAFIDDATRVVPFAAFDTAENIQAFLPVFRNAIIRRGIPQRLYVDNGASYRSRHLALVCARLGIALIHARPYQPAGKGKIERWFRTLRAGWLAHLDAPVLDSLQTLNRSLWAWIEGEYHNTPHRGLEGRTPLEQWALASAGVRYPDATVERSRSSAHHAIRTEISRLAKEARQLPVLVIDEAHHLRNDVLEDLRLLTNFAMDSENRMCLILVGLTELRRRLAMAVHESLSQRLVVRHHLTGLERDEVDAYLKHRLRLAGCELPLFEPPAVEALFQGARGLPRQINRIAHYALSAAALDNARTVNAGHLQNALDELRP